MTTKTQTKFCILMLGMVFIACSKRSENCKSNESCESTGGVYAGASSQGGSETGGSNEGGGGVGGTSGGESSTGGTTTIPCNGACSGSKPVCNAVTNVCVECTSKTDCKDPLKPACNSANVCVGCVEGKDCSTDPLRRVCDTETSTCVGCLLTQSCNADPFNHVCNTTTKMCVSCMTNTDCPTATASRCDTSTNTCGVCQVDSDCSQIGGKGVCSAGTCVQCTPEKETACGANSCNPLTKECSATARGSVGKCQSCKADSECMGGDIAPQTARCIPLTYGETNEPHGTYCLQIATVVNCTSPFKVNIATKSVIGVDGIYCGINQTATTCEAVNDLIASKSCANGTDVECGNSKGGLCKDFSLTSTPDLRCTIPCIEAIECTGIRTCTADAPYCH